MKFWDLLLRILFVLDSIFFIQSLPIFTSISPLESEQIVISYPPNETNCPPDHDYPIPADRFSHLVSTHWQFDHLDTIKSGMYQLISEQFQKHIQIRSHHPQSIQWDMMDLEILQAQISGAIQAHTEGSLHLAWDRLGDPLGQPALDLYIRRLAADMCSYSENMISATCLRQNATELSQELDKHITQHLTRVFDALDRDTLPQLLEKTSRDLLDVLGYFNQLFDLPEHQQLDLQVLPWVHGQLRSSLLLLDTLNDDHLLDFFSNYACLSTA